MNGLLHFWARTRTRCDDAIDRLSCLTSVHLLLLLGAIAGLKQYSGKPIDCWCPAHFTNSHIAFTESLCWTNNVHFVTVIGQRNQTTGLLMMVEKISYYKFVPIILALQALLCAVPGLIWKSLCRQSRFDLLSVMSAANEMRMTPDAPVDSILRQLKPLMISAKQGGSTRRCYGGSRMNVAYVMAKLGYTCNALVQLVLLNMALELEQGVADTDLLTSHIYGTRLVLHLLRGDHGELNSKLLPRFTFCEFRTYSLGMESNVNIVQCALRINEINQMIFSCVWFWLLLLFWISIISLFTWSYRLVSYSSCEAYVIDLVVEISEADPKEVSRFMASCISRDIVMTVKLIDINYGRFVASGVMSALWQQWQRECPRGKCATAKAGIETIEL